MTARKFRLCPNCRKPQRVGWIPNRGHVWMHKVRAHSRACARVREARARLAREGSA